MCSFVLVCVYVSVRPPNTARDQRLVWRLLAPMLADGDVKEWPHRPARGPNGMRMRKQTRIGTGAAPDVPGGQRKQ